MRKFILCLVTLAIFSSAVANNADDTRIWNLKKVDIIDVIHEVSRETGKNFVIPPSLSGKVSIISTKPINKDQLYSVFLSALHTLGYSVVHEGVVYSIEKTQDAAQLGPGEKGDIVVRIVALKNISAPQMIPVLRPMLPSWSNVTSYMPDNILIATGPEFILDQVIKTLKQVDDLADDDISVVPVQQGDAVEIVEILKNLQMNTRMHGRIDGYTVVADGKNNQILVSGSRAQQIKMRLLIAKLDKTAVDDGNLAVVFLRYQKAKTLANTLNDLEKKSASELKGPRELSHEVSFKIVADEKMNAIVLSGPNAQIKKTKHIIRQLDIQPSEVLVQAVIAEVGEGELNNLGVEWGTIKKNGVEATSSSLLNTITAGFTSGVGVIVNGRLQAVVDALTTRTGSNLLSTPSIMVLDNEKATISVGKEVPRETGSYATSDSSTTATPFTTVNMEKVALTLNVTPQINLSDRVQLKIELTNDSLENPKDPGLNFIKNTSSINNTVMIKDNDILVLGGLISNTEREVTKKMPILGSLPLLGKLFQHQETEKDKRVLVVFIKPTIMRSSDQLMKMTGGRYEMIRNLQKNWNESHEDQASSITPNVLPDMNGKVTLPLPFSEDHE